MAPKLKAFHEMEDVYADSLYALVIMPEHSNATSADFKVRRDISLGFQRLDEQSIF
jgi:hypothetical protein